MGKIAIFEKRFDELLSQLQDVEKTRRPNRSDFSFGDLINDEMLLNWKVKAKNLLSKACGRDSEHFTEFQKNEGGKNYRSSAGEMDDLKAIFMAAKEDYEGGYCQAVRGLVQSELFDSELEQARELLSGGYLAASAVIAGVVLETTLRQLCDDNGIPIGKMDKMNSDLAKAAIYGKLVQKRITALADIRNNAAHGHPDQFGREDVVGMIDEIEKFVGDHV